MQTESDTGSYRWLIVPVVVAAGAALVFWLGPSAPRWASTLGLGESSVATEIAYQLASLGLAAAVLAVAYLLAPDNFTELFGPGDLDAAVEPVPWLGLNPGPDERWRQVGRDIGVVVTGVTAVVIFLQVVRGGEFRASRLLSHAHWILGFALVNSFVEEMICRQSLVAPLFDLIAPRHLYLLSGAIFGGFHYFGTPGGPAGVVLAGFLGWFLAKSLVEMRGLFFVWTIHFLQDVVIFGAQLSTPA